MAQLTGADAGYEDVGAFTASSAFQYNANAFGKNVPYLGERSLSIAYGLEPSVFKTNPFNAKVDRFNVRTIASNGKILAKGLEQAVFQLNPYKRASDSSNVKQVASLSDFRQRSFAANDTPTVFKYAPKVDRFNVKQTAANGSDSIVRGRSKRQYVWGSHNPKALVS